VGHNQNLKENDQWDRPKKNVQSGTIRHQEERKELARNQSKVPYKEIERMETFCPMVSSKWKQC